MIVPDILSDDNIAVLRVMKKKRAKQDTDGFEQVLITGTPATALPTFALSRYKKPTSKPESKSSLVFMCKPCDTYFNQRELLEKHMKKVHGQKAQISMKPVTTLSPIVAYNRNKSVCTKAKSILERLRERAGGYCKNDNNTFMCNYCTFDSPVKENVINHVDSAHKSLHQRLQAEIRGGEEPREIRPEKVFEVEETVDIVSEHVESTFSCPNCDYESSERGEINEHIVKVHDANWYDNEAQKTAQDEEKRLRQRMTNTKYECHYCTFKATNGKDMRAHTKREHPGYVQPPKPKSTVITEYKCDQCDFVSLDRQKIKVHIERKHVTELRYTCEYCGKKYKVKCDLTSHIRFQHFKTPTVCHVCGKLCSNSNSLHIHQKRKHFAPDFACHLCSRRMVSQENLDEHILRQHTQKAKYMCDQCGKQFDQPNKLRQHERTHTGEKPHICHICGKAFARRAVFRQHLLIHTGERPYVCDICGKAFTQKPGLICHRKSHPGPKPPLPTVYIDHILTKFVMETERKEEVVYAQYEEEEEEVDVSEMMAEDEEE